MPLAALLQLDETRLRRAVAKLTHVGPQTGPVNTVVIQVYSFLPSLELFQSLRTAGLSYTNDELPFILNFSVAPDEFRRIVAEAGRVWQATHQAGGQPSLSFTALADTPEGLQGGELLFSHSAGVALHQALNAVLDPVNGIGRVVLEKQRTGAYSK